MSKRKLVAGLVATTVMGLAGTARADAPAHYFVKSNENCTTVSIIDGHWTADFNPSSANAFWREANCGAPTTVASGALG